MKNFKKILSICIIALVVIATAVTSTVIFGGKGKGGVPAPETQEENINWLDYGIYQASAEEETGASVAPEHMKGGAVYIGKGSELEINKGTFEYHEGYFGGCFYIADGGVLTMTGGTIRYNGAMYCGAIYVEDGGICIIDGGAIEYNSAQYAPAIYVEDGGKLIFGDNIENEGSILAKNEYADYGEFEIRYYVDGLLSNYSEQKIAAFKTDEAPLSYAECNGWFLDEEMTEPIEEGDVLQYTEPEVVVQSASDYTKIIKVYSKSATLDKLTFTELDSGLGYSAAGKSGITGDVVIPKEYDDKPVNALAVHAFYGFSIDSCYIPSSITILADGCFRSSTIKHVNFTDDILSIGKNAFQYCAQLQTIKLNEGLTSIGVNAFERCTALENFTFPESIEEIGEYAFNVCTSLTNLTLPNINAIKTAAFANVTGITEITIPSSVERIEKSAFYGCTKLNTVEFLGNNIFVDNYGFGDCTALNNLIIKTTSGLEYQSFIGCPLEEITIKEELTYNFSSIQKTKTTKVINLGEGVTTIPNSVFYGMTALTTVNIPTTVTNIYGFAFYECIDFKNFNIAEGSQLEYIAIGTFYGCTSLQTITIPENVTSIEQNAFKNCTSLSTITIPENVQTIGQNAFSNCTSLSTINILATEITGVTTDNKIFENAGSANGCELKFIGTNQKIPANLINATSNQITKMYFGKGVSVIGEYAFGGCLNLQTVEFEKVVTTIEQYAFNGCSNITKVIISNVDDFAGIEFKASASNPLFYAHNLYLGEDKITNLVVGDVDIGNYAFIGGDFESIELNGSTSIGTYAFGFAKSVKKMSVPNTVTTVGIRPFDSSSITELEMDMTTVPQAVTQGMNKLNLVTIGINVQDVSDSAFSGAYIDRVNICGGVNFATNSFQYSNVKTVYVNIESTAALNCLNYSSVTTLEIGKDVKVFDQKFLNAKLTTISVDSQNTVFSSYGGNCIVDITSKTLLRGAVGEIPQEVLIIGTQAYSNCGAIESLTIPTNVTTLNDNAFYNCTITELSLPNSLTNISTNAFKNAIYKVLDFDLEVVPNTFMRNTDITELKFRSNVRQISGYAFANCTNLDTVLIDDGLETISEYAFHGCTKLTTFVTPNTLKTIGGATFMGCTGLTMLSLSESIESLGSGMCIDCSSLTSITIPSKVTRLVYQSFRNCSMLAQVTFSDVGNFESIEGMVFENCTTLASVTLPEGIKKIYSYAFRNTALNSIYLPSSVQRIGRNCFNTCTTVTFASAAYENHTWQIQDSYGVLFYDVDVSNPTENAVRMRTELTDAEGNEDGYYYIRDDYDAYVDNSTQFFNFNLRDNGTEYAVSAIDIGISGEIIIPSKYNGKLVTAIAANGFADCSDITSVVIPDSVTSIGDRAFSGCSNLVSINIPNGVTSIGHRTFSGCSNLVSINIPNGVTSIGYELFYDCSSLTSINLPEGVTQIGNTAFCGCQRLTSINIPDTVTSIGSQAFFGCNSLTSLKLPDGITYIGRDFCRGCSNLISINIPDTVTSIGDSAFESCSVETIKLPDGLISIGDFAFAYSALANINIPDSVTSIGDEAFRECDFTSIDLPDGITSIGNHLFDSCVYLTSIIVPENVTSIGENAFRSCRNLISINLPDTVTSIGDSAFQACGVKTIKLPDGLISIGDSAFQDCSVETIKLPDGLISIGDSAFAYSDLANINIPDSVTSIGKNAFRSCNNLTSVTFVDPYGWYVSTDSAATSGTNLTLTDPAQNAVYLKETYDQYYWFKGEPVVNSFSYYYEDLHVTRSYIEGMTWADWCGSEYNTDGWQVDTYTNSIRKVVANDGVYQINIGESKVLPTDLILADDSNPAGGYTRVGNLEDVISFSIYSYGMGVDETYFAVEGMTWGEWMQSVYFDTDSLIEVSDNYNYPESILTWGDSPILPQPIYLDDLIESKEYGISLGAA